jgi:transaldolase / glucose-6-phosphate isomerase
VYSRNVENVTLHLTSADSVLLHQTLDDWKSNGKVNRLWARDASVWTGADEGNWLGWLDIVDQQRAGVELFQEIAVDVKSAGFSHVLLLGMGGSSLCPEVLKMSFKAMAGSPELHVLDSTDPGQVRSVEQKIDLKNTLFIVSSKSGSTLEPNIFKQYFYEKSGCDGSRFYAVTDPGSKMQEVAERDNCRRIFPGIPSIGGRYSALSNFGMVPAAAMGIDVKKFLDNAKAMAEQCKEPSDLKNNPGVLLGALIGSQANAGRDKLTLIASAGIFDLGAWLEQLIAESTGKIGKGIIPVDREELLSPEYYGKDRVFAYERLENGADPMQDRLVDALAAAGHPVVRFNVKDAYQLGAEFFRWEIAVAVAGSVMGINPFDQPDVEASKIVARKLTAEYEENGALPAETPALEDNGIKVYGEAKGTTLVEALRAHLNTINTGDYFALLGYLEMSLHHELTLQAIRSRVLKTKKVATCLGFGPRFLHSTGQAYKGGPNTGVFLQITADDASDLPIPGRRFTFGVVKAAQARGDLEVLKERGRRALRIHLGKDVRGGLATLASAVERALQ